jgi:CheY-like chemotaxis protein
MTPAAAGYSARVRGDGPIRVLVVDDEAPIRLLCRVNLEADGMEVLEAATGRAALALAREQRPDVVLLDVGLPDLDGWHVVDELLADERTREIPVVFLTASAAAADQERGLGAGAVDYLTKPFNPLALGWLLEQHLERVLRGERDALRGEKLAELRGAAPRSS